MKAKPGRPARSLKLQNSGGKVRRPKGLTPEQRREFAAVIGNPVSRGADEALIRDFMAIAKLRDIALTAIEKDGLIASDGKIHAGWQVFRGCQQMLARLRGMMMLTPRAQAELRASGVLDPQPDDPADPDDIPMD